MAIGILERPVAVAAGVFEVPRGNRSELTDGQLGDRIVGVETSIQQLTCERARLIGEFEARGAYRADGALTPRAWLGHKLRMTPGDAAIARRAGRTVREVPALAEAFAEGRTTARHVDLIGRAVAKHGADALAPHEDVLLRFATTRRPADLKVVLERIDEALDPDGASEAEMRRQASRHLTFVKTFDGMYDVRGLFSAEDGETVLSAVLPLAKPRPDVEGPDPRSAGERNLDAIVELCRVALDRGELPGIGGDKPHVTLVVDLPSLRNESVGGAGNAATALWGASLGQDALLRLCCDAAVTAVVTDAVNGTPLDPDTLGALRDGQGRLLGLGQPLAAGREVRTVTTAQRRALVVRNGGCVFPGCGRATGFCDAHHAIDHWSHGGHTDLDNLVLVCRRHHRKAHEDGWQFERDPERRGLFQLRPPTRGPPIPCEHTIDRDPGSRLPL